MNKIDIEYENAIRTYLDRALILPRPDKKDEPNLNPVKSFIEDIKKTVPKGFKFSTPMFVWWDLTSRCNFRCKHCLYNACGYTGIGDLTPAKAQVIADELIYDLQISQVILSGGEIFTRSDILELVRKFKSNNVSVKLLTNGALLTDKIIKELSELLNPYTDNMQVSLDGATYETFKEIRQTDTFDKVIENIRKLTKSGIVVQTATTVNTINYKEVLDIYKLCDLLGVQVMAVGRMEYYNESHKSLMMDDRELMILASKLFAEESKYKTKLAVGLFDPMRIFHTPEIRRILEEDKYQEKISEYKIPLARSCNSHDRLSIKSNGEVYMCSKADCVENSCMGNVHEASLLDIWENRWENIFFQERKIEKMPCNSCKYKVLCNSGCLVKAYETFGTLNMPEYDCSCASPL